MASAVIARETIETAVRAAVEVYAARAQETGVFEPARATSEAIGAGHRAFLAADNDAMLERVLAQIEPYAMVKRMIEAEPSICETLTGIEARHLTRWVEDMRPPPEVFMLALKAARHAERSMLEGL